MVKLMIILLKKIKINNNHDNINKMTMIIAILIIMIKNTIILTTIIILIMMTMMVLIRFRLFPLSKLNYKCWKPCSPMSFYYANSNNYSWTAYNHSILKNFIAFQKKEKKVSFCILRAILGLLHNTLLSAWFENYFFFS